MSNNSLVRYPSLVSRELREAAVVRFTDLPGSGKSTTAHDVRGILNTTTLREATKKKD